MKHLNRLLLVLVSLLFIVDIVYAAPAGDLSTQGRASFVARDGNNLYLGNEGDDDFVVVQNNVTTFSIDGATGAVTFTGTLTPKLPNNTYLTAKNAAGDADIDVLKVDASDNTVLNSSASDELILQLADDASRTINFTGTSDTALAIKFGDAGVTAAQVLNFGASTADADDDASFYLNGGGGNSTSRGGFIRLDGNESGNSGSVTLEAGNSVGSRIYLRTGGTSRWQVGAANELLGSTATATSYLIGTNSVDATDSNILFISSGSAGAASRGGHAFFYGNEASGGAGAAGLAGGAVATGNINLDLGHASAGVQFRNTSGNQMWIMDNTGAFSQNATNGSALVFNVSGSGLRMGTSDSADNKYLALAGGGGFNSTARGAGINLYGNEGGNTGDVEIFSGAVSGSDINLTSYSSNGYVLFGVNGLIRWFVDPVAGSLVQNSTNGGSIVLTKADTYVSVPNSGSGIAAAGTTIADATQLTKMLNQVTSGTGGVKFSANDQGALVMIKNATGSAINIYPATAGGFINALGAGVAFSLAADKTVICFRGTGSSYWQVAQVD